MIFGFCCQLGLFIIHSLVLPPIYPGKTVQMTSMMNVRIRQKVKNSNNFKQNFHNFKQNFRNVKQNFRNFKQTFRNSKQKFRSLKQNFCNFKQNFRNFKQNFVVFKPNFSLLLSAIAQVIAQKTKSEVIRIVLGNPLQLFLDRNYSHIFFIKSRKIIEMIVFVRSVKKFQFKVYNFGKPLKNVFVKLDSIWKFIKSTIRN